MDEVLPGQVRTLEWKDLPVEIIDLIVTYCSGPTVLRLRLVSTSIKEIVDTSPRLKDVVGEVGVVFDSERLPTFTMKAPDFPFQHFHIYTDDFNLLATPLLQPFIQRFSSKIRKLRVTNMFCGAIDGEVDFYESLVKLRVLEVDLLRPMGKVRHQIVSGPGGLSMKVLKVQKEINTGDYIIKWIKRCPSLEEIALPDELGSGTGTIGRETYGGATLKRDHSYPYILRLGAEGHLPHLRILHLCSQPMDMRLCSEQDAQFFYKLLTEREGLQVWNVKAKMLEEVRKTCVPPEWEWKTLDAFKRRIRSLCGMHGMLQGEGFETLEELTFNPLENVLSRESEEVGPLRLPGLKKVQLRIQNLIFGVTVDQQRFLDRLCLPEEPRWSVEHLALFFHSRNPVEGITLNPAYLDQGFPNLRSVSLDLDGFSREQKVEVIEVMSRKPFLEELTLNTSSGIPEEAFCRGVEESPVLLFPNLKKLRLSWYDRAGMGVMTDRSLQLFGRMGLSHLSIKGTGCESVTNEGVRMLLEGTLGRTVVSVELTALEVEGDEERKKLLDDVKEVARRNKARLT